MRTLKTYETAQKYLNDLNAKAKEIMSLEKQLEEKKQDLEKTLACLRAYKKRGVVKKISQYHYEINL